MKHGRAAEVVVPEADAAEVARLEAELAGEMRPSGPLGRLLVRRTAVLANRLDRCARHEAAAVRERARVSGLAFEDERVAEVEALGLAIAADPARSVARLKRTVEGLDWLLRAWLVVKGELVQLPLMFWGINHLTRVENLLGRKFEQYPRSELDAIGRAVWGDFSGLAPDQAGDLDKPARTAWARAEVGRVVDAEIAALVALRAEVEAATDRDLDRAEAADRALFDPSKEAVQARKYEAAAERGLFRTLREFRQVEAEAAARPEVAEELPAPLGSFEPEADAVPEPIVVSSDSPMHLPARPLGLALPAQDFPVQEQALMRRAE